MRVAVFLVLAACAAPTLRDVPPDRAIDRTKALLAGRLEFGGSEVEPKLELKALEGGKVFVVRPEYATFLVEVPPGTYLVERFGRFGPSSDRLTIDAVAGVIRYVGTFRAEGSDDGLRILVANEFLWVVEELVDRYGPELPEMESGLVQSEQAATIQEGEELVVEVVPRASSGPSFRFGFGIG